MKNIDFKPKISYAELDYFLRGPSFEKSINSDRVYAVVKKLVEKASPSYEDEHEKRWEYFYLPAKRRTLICIPLFVLEYGGEFFVNLRSFGFGNLRIWRCRDETENVYSNIFRETIRFLPLIKKHGVTLLEKLVPYDIRTGKIKGKYIMEKVMKKEEGERILLEYEEYLKKNLEVSRCTLKEYLEVSAICYMTAFGDETKGMTPLEMYKKWADGRDGGMLAIKNNSEKEFEKWHSSGEWAGSHPFEIVFSLINHGIHLYPPSRSSPHYVLMVTNYAYARKFIRMAEALMKNSVAFRASGLEDVLNYLEGETYFRVNEFSEHFFFYSPTREYKKRYFTHIEWDELKIANLK